MDQPRPRFLSSSRGLLCLSGLFLILFALAFFNRGIHNDEAWIGQHVWSLKNHDLVESELLRDYPPLDGKVIVYHKLLVWAGVLFSSILGWGLFQLRAISALTGLLTLVIVYRYLSLSKGVAEARLAVLILMFSPIFWEQMLEFRPEALLLLCGFSSYMVIEASRVHNKLSLFVLGGVLAGLAGLTHAFGFVFVVAGTIALVFERRWLGAFIVLISGTVAFSPYFAGFYTDHQLFIEQTINNPLMTTSFDFSWWQPFVNLITEHKRVLRKPEVIGLAIWFLLSLCLVNREFFRRHKFTFVYLLALAIVLAASPLPKFTRYMIPLVPFMAVTIAVVWTHIDEFAIGKRALLKPVFLGWALLFSGYGLFALGAEVYPRHASQIKANGILAEHMNQGSLVIAPFDFVYMQQGKYTIQSWWGAERKAEGNKSPEFIETYADAIGVDYIVADSLFINEWHVSESSVGAAFHKYQLIFSVADPKRYLFERVRDN